MSSELDLLRQENAKLVGVLMTKIVELEQTAKENAELKARVTKLEQKQLQNDISSNTGSSSSSFISPNCNLISRNVWLCHSQWNHCIRYLSYMGNHKLYSNVTLFIPCKPSTNSGT